LTIVVHLVIVVETIWPENAVGRDEGFIFRRMKKEKVETEAELRLDEV
jgi:hypothetical protein